MTAFLKGGRSQKEIKLDEDRRKVLELKASIMEREKKLLSRQAIRDLDYNAIVREKESLERDSREMEKLKRSITKRESTLK